VTTLLKKYNIKVILSVFISFSFLIIFTQTVSASTYFVSNSGSDSNIGTSETNPWKTISKVNNFSFEPNSHINFKKGDVWYEKLVVPNSDLYFGTYGDGDYPIYQHLVQEIIVFMFRK
jgi:hypothetical protein